MPLEMNDFLAQFLSNSLEKEKVKISPLQIELLYYLKSRESATPEEILEKNRHIDRKKLIRLLNDMERRKLIRRKSPYRLDKKGVQLIEKCSRLEKNVEPLLTHDFFYSRLYRVSSNSIKTK